MNTCTQCGKDSGLKRLMPDNSWRCAGCVEMEESAHNATLAARSALRDQFAMAALTGLLAQEYPFDTEISEKAYKFADAMLKAREANTP